MRLPLLLLLLLLRGLAAAPGYVVTLRGSFSTTRLATVTINGDRVEVLLHNATIVSFRVPEKYVTDRALLATASVKVHVKPSVKNLPLFALESALVKVDVDDFREQLRGEQPHARRKKPRDSLHAAGGGEATDRVDAADRERAAEGNGEEGNTGPRTYGEADDDVEVVVEDEDEGEDEDAFDNDLGEDLEVEDEEAMEAPHEQMRKDEGHEEEYGEEEQPPEEPTAAEPPQPDEWMERVAEAEAALQSSKDSKQTMQAIETLHSAVEAGYPRAEVSLASILLSGRNGIARDRLRAVRLLRSAAGKGHPDAQALLGFFHASGLVADVSRDTGAAVLLWTFAAEGGSPFGKMALAYRYFTATDVAKDCPKAAKYYKDVADEVYNSARVDLSGRQRQKRAGDNDAMADIRPPTPRAMFNSDLKRLSEDMTKRVLGEANEIVQYYRHSADRGDTGAQVVMGTLYYYGGNYMPQDVPRARRLFETAAAKGRAEAYAHLGFMELQAGRNDTAAKHLGEAARRGDKLGFHGMGFITLHGIGVKQDARRAAEFFSKAASEKHPEAIYNLGVMFSQGIGVNKSPSEALQHFQEAARLGHMQSNYKMGIRMLSGIFPPNKDCNMAVRFLKRVAEQGVWNKIQSKAFKAYERGDFADALFRYLQAAHAGIDLAQYNAAFMYEKNLLSNSDGFKNDIASVFTPSRAQVVEEALQLYSMSSAQNSDHSMVRMGDLAFGEAKDYPRAVAAYESATKMENAEATFNLGWMHARGYGMNPDRHMAKRYFDQAMELDRDAILPATIAVYSLQYSDKLFEIVERVSLFMERCRRLTDGSWRYKTDEESETGSIAVVDAVVLTVLLGILVAVVNARQRRLMHAARDANAENTEGNDLDNQAAQVVPEAPRPPNERNEPQN